MDMDWRGKAFVVGGVLGALLGLGAAYIYINAAEQSGEPPEVSPGTAVTVGLSLLALLRQVAAIGEGGDHDHDDDDDKKKKKKK